MNMTEVHNEKETMEQQQVGVPHIAYTPIVQNDDDGCFVALYENVLSIEESLSYLTELHSKLPFQMYNDDFGQQSRPTCYFGDDSNCIFTYVGLCLQPLEWPTSLLKLRQRIIDTCQLSSGSPLTACLVNLYPFGEGHIPWHYDEVRAHGHDKIVASLSLGGPRRFQLRRRRVVDSDQCIEQELVFDQLLSPGSVLLMKGNTQQYYEHCLPLETETDPLRISLTFRSIVPGYEQNKEIATDKCCVK